MVGRPPLSVGTYGKVQFVDQRSGTIQARALVRDYDGRVRVVTKVGRSRAAAERALREVIRDRQLPGADLGVSGSSTVTELADAWLGEEHDWSISTDRVYRSMVNAQIKPALGELRLREVNAGVIARMLSAVSKHAGAGAAKTTRTALSGMFAVAVRDGAVPTNPVRDAGARLGGRVKERPRALSAEEESRVVGLFAGSERAQALDLVDVVDWMLATGCRIGEALALRVEANADGRPLIDLDAATWEVNGTVVRQPRRGLLVQPRTKTDAGWRAIAIPPFAVDLIRRRGVSGSPVFTSPVARELRDPTNVSNELRRLLDGFDCRGCAGTGLQMDAEGTFVLNEKGRRVRCDEGPWSWVTSHTFRKTVATKLDAAGFSPREVADHLGHANPSMTLDVYFGRHVVSAAAATALARTPA